MACFPVLLTLCLKEEGDLVNIKEVSMKRKRLLSAILGLELILAVSLTGCASNADAKTGVLEGKASIGPRPAQEIGQPYPTEVYQLRKVMVYDAEHVQLIMQIDLDSNGYYRAELPADTYTIDINYYGNDHSDNVPRQMKIEPGVHLMFDIDFDIGIEDAVTPPPITSPPPPKTDWEKGSPPPAGIEGWQQPRPLTENEKARVVEIAVSSPEASAWLQGRADYRTAPVNWYAIIWSPDGEAGTWWAPEYKIVDEGIPSYVNPYAYWYPGVTIAVGEGTIYQMQIAVDLDTGKTAMVDGPYPSLSSPDRFPQLVREYPLEVMRAVYEEILRELFDKRNLYDKISMTGYSSGWISLSFYEKADPEIVDMVGSIINEKVPGAQLIVEEDVTSFRGSTREMPRISKGQAIETAAKTLPKSIVDRADISAEIHGWYWEVIFDNLNALADELMPFPLKGPPPPPPGQPTTEPYPGIWQAVIIAVDSQTGDLKSAGACRAPQPGPYVSESKAIESAREFVLRVTDWSWNIDNAKVEAYLVGDIWTVLFWEEGSTDNRIKASVDAVTGAAKGAGRG